LDSFSGARSVEQELTICSRLLSDELNDDARAVGELHLEWLAIVDQANDGTDLWVEGIDALDADKINAGTAIVNEISIRVLGMVPRIESFAVGRSGECP